MMDDRKLNDLQNAVVSYAMERNTDAIIAAYWRGGVAKVNFENGELVVTTVAPEEMYDPSKPAGNAPQS